jgi:hypothetical protein
MFNQPQIAQPSAPVFAVPGADPKAAKEAAKLAAQQAKEAEKQAKAAEKQAAALAKQKPVEVAQEQNGIKAPKPLSSTANIWALASALSTYHKRMVTVEEVLEAVANHNNGAYPINLEGWTGFAPIPLTVKTAFTKWATFYGAVLPTPAPKVAKVAEPKLPKVEKVVQNGVAHPHAHTSAGKIWNLASTMSSGFQRPATIGELVAAAEAHNAGQSQIGLEGWAGWNVTIGNVKAEYPQWKKFHGIAKVVDVVKANEKAQKEAEKFAAKEQAKQAKLAAKAAQLNPGAITAIPSASQFPFAAQ